MRALTHETRIRLAVAFGAFAIAYGLCVARIGHGAPDFYVFWTAAQHWQTPYDPAIIARLQAAIHLGGTWPFAYPPTFLLLAWPFAQLPLTIAYPLWTGLNCGAFFYAAAHLVRPSYATALLAITPVVFFAAELGQTSLPVGAALIGAWLTRDSRPALAGMLLGIAACAGASADRVLGTLAHAGLDDGERGRTGRRESGVRRATLGRMAARPGRLQHPRARH
jgi:hypothetical protein